MRELLIILLAFSSIYLSAQEIKLLSDTTESGYQNLDNMGGPKSVGAQLVANNERSAFYFRVPIKVTKPWYDFKKRVNENTGIQFGINYTSVFMYATQVISDSNRNNTSGGILDIQFGWNLVNRKAGKNKGTLFIKIDSRHTYGDFTSPMFHGINESGYYGLPATGFRTYTIRMLEFNWQQNFIKDKLTVIVGKVDPTNYFNFHGLIVPWQHYLGYGTSVSGTVNWPDMGFGILAGYKFSDKFYAMAGLTDVRGDVYNDGDFLYFGENFFKGNFFKVIEVGFVGSMAERYFKKVSLTYWHSDPYTSVSDAEIPMGQGIAFSSHWFFKERFIPFVRVAFSNGNGENAFYKRDIQVGHGFRFRTHDILAIAFSTAQTNVPGSKEQSTMEIFYRFNLTEHFEITPDYQLVINPTFNPNHNTLSYFGIRGRITL